MSQFSYKAVARDGRLTQGHMEGSDQRAIAQRIQGMGLIPIAIEQTVAKTQRARTLFQGITQKDILFFTEELATLINAGLPLDRSLSITAELASKPALRIGVKPRNQCLKVEQHPRCSKASNSMIATVAYPNYKP